MAQLYFSLVTNLGRIKLAASASGGPAVTITHFAIGDGNGAEVNPTALSTTLVREVWRTGVESVEPDPLNPAAVLVTAIIPIAQGGWWMREFGIFDADGDMIAVAKPVSQYKPTAIEGQLEDIRYEFQIVIGETANVTLLVDPSILLASREWVETRKTPINRLLQTPWLPVKSMTVTAPPAAPAGGDIYVIPPAATGIWAGHSQELAEWTGAAWALISPPDGHGISLPDGRVFERVAGSYVEKLALDVQSGKWAHATATGTANALTVTLTPTPEAYTPGMRICVKIAANNTGPVTINVNGLGVKQVRRRDGAQLVDKSLVAGQVADLVYDGTNFQVESLPGGAGPYSIGAIKQIAVSGTYASPAGCRAILIEGMGGGGAGGGAQPVSSGQISIGGGGGAGGYFRKLIANPDPSYIITIGAGGVSASGEKGGNGGTTSFGSVASATGGAGGASVIIGVDGATSAAGGDGGQGTGGDINSSGGIGGRGATSGAATGGYGGSGGNSFLGGNGLPSGSASNNGYNARGPGGGGGGAVINNAGYPARSGGGGGAGIIIVTEYF